MTFNKRSKLTAVESYIKSMRGRIV